MSKELQAQLKDLESEYVKKRTDLIAAFYEKEIGTSGVDNVSTIETISGLQVAVKTTDEQERARGGTDTVADEVVIWCDTNVGKLVLNVMIDQDKAARYGDADTLTFDKAVPYDMKEVKVLPMSVQKSIAKQILKKNVLEKCIVMEDGVSANGIDWDYFREVFEDILE